MLPEVADLHCRVLIVDDEEMLCETVAFVLICFGLEVLQAGNGQEAIEVFRNQRDNVDLVIMDMTMPKMDGLTRFVRLRELQPDIRVTLCSGCTEINVADQARAEGLAGCVQKPYRVECLMQQIASLLQGD